MLRVDFERNMDFGNTSTKTPLSGLKNVFTIVINRKGLFDLSLIIEQLVLLPNMINIFL